MRLDDVQAHVLAQLRTDPTLGALNAVNLYDPTVSQEDERALVNAIIKRCGFCIQIAEPFIPPNATQTNNAGVSQSTAHQWVFIAEDRTRPHTPAGLLLASYVKKAINARNDQRHMTGTDAQDAAEDDNGLIIRRLVFIYRVQDDQAALPVIQAGLTDNAGNAVTDNSGNQMTSP